jgi:indolepyruvate ferredoxin oxidoreductase beta subunit
MSQAIAAPGKSGKSRIFLTGVGGQGTLTATTMLARTALDRKIEVTSGEIHGMAQRGGVVESTVLLGGYLSPRISHGEADVLLGFEPLETLRALPYLAPGAVVVSSSDPQPPIGVSMGRETYPALGDIEARVRACASRTWFVPCAALAAKAGSAQSANMVLLGAACAAGVFPFGLDALEDSVRKYLKPALVDLNLKAIALGAEAVAASA